MTGRPRVDGAASEGSEATDSEALVPCGGVFEGQVAILGATRIEGTVRGSLRGPGELILGRDARVEGVIDCDVLSSRGEVIGPIVARSRVHLAMGARCEGDLEAPVVLIDDEAVWNGRARIGGRGSD
ncbi:MAG: hypothetical protein CL908_16840 [Deltaproteobacteria bacterium]|jgi:cytoskeletal protein CcmA (bactofilin family)|nr:hypothetical protein [Deltaproteobacteria bacterium]